MIRYIKRFTGTKKMVDYKIVLQQWTRTDEYDELLGEWQDLTPENAEWETPEQEKTYIKATNYAFEHQR